MIICKITMATTTTGVTGRDTRVTGVTTSVGTEGGEEGKGERGEEGGEEIIAHGQAHRPIKGSKKGKRGSKITGTPYVKFTKDLPVDILSNTG